MTPPASFATALLAWFVEHARVLPWRQTLDPYAIWVSEIMLQQTQVKTVIPYFTRWLASLPTVGDLAAAPEARVLKLWEGLGYYRRARNLQKAAQQVCASQPAALPSTAAGWEQLPGIGRYTAGAIASIAFNEPAPILDGNVIRVLTRLHALPGDPRERGLNARLWTLATELVTAANSLPPVRLAPPMRLAGNCSALNQALMELGATVCTPTAPRCGECPLAPLCAARRMGKAEAFPQTASRVPATTRQFVAGLWQKQGRWLVRQRPAEAINGGLWEFPNVEVPAASPNQPADLASHLGAKPEALTPFLTVRHTITRFRITVHVFEVAGKTPVGLAQLGHWADAAELQTLAFTSAHRRIVQQLLATDLLIAKP